jgi:hypothetical protein
VIGGVTLSFLQYPMSDSYFFICHSESIKDPKTINEGVKINEILSGLFGYL